MGRIRRNRPKARRSRQQPSQKVPTRRRRAMPRNSSHGSLSSRRTIRLSKNIQTQQSHSGGIPHPRQPSLLANVMSGSNVRQKPGSSKQPSHRHEASNLPLPLPDTARNGIAFAAANTLSPMKPTSSRTGISAQRSFTPLPPLPSLATKRLDVAYSSSTGVATAAPAHHTALENNIPQDYTGLRKMGVPLIVALSICSGLLILGLYLVVLFVKRRRRISRIKPSLPILEKAYTLDEDSFNLDGKESPVFGGKERSTSRLGVEGPLWTWVQYAKPDPARLSSVSQTQDNARRQSEQASAMSIAMTTAGDRRFSIASRTESAPQSIVVAPSKNRFSTSTLYRNRESREVPTAITGDGYPILERSRSKLARRSQSHSILDRKRRESTYRSDSAYDGADVSSPTTYFQPVSTPNFGTTPATGIESRERIQSSYYAAYPRMSSMPASFSIGTARKVHISNAYASEMRDISEETETQGSPSVYVPASPGGTLYPDDSMSVIATAKQKRRSQCENKRQSKFLTAETTSTKGLPEMDFGISRMSMSELAECSNDNIYSNFQSNAPNTVSKPSAARTHDRPPRVPSPPPLPSLAQMALAHGNAEAYGTYRSPTYSLYGLYGNDRKSTAAP